MKIKDYLMAVGAAAAGALALVFVFWVLSLMSWAFVWACIVMCSLPFCYKLTQEYHESDEIDFVIFIIEKIKDAFDDKPKQSDIEW